METRTIDKWFAKYFICPTIFSAGHEPEDFLTETKDFIYTKRCKRCHSTIGFGHYKHLDSYPLPEDFNRKEWEDYCNKRMQEIRDEFK